jgi:hypothetical protein
LNYNFARYRPEGTCLNSTTFDKGTIEFREAAGSMNPEVAANWAAMCVNLVHFARTADLHISIESSTDLRGQRRQR